MIFITKNRTLLHLLLLLPVITFSQTNVPVGSRSAGMAHASVTNIDAWGTFNNQAVLAGITNTELSAYFENRFGVSGLNTGAFTAAIPVKKGCFGVSYRQFGISTYLDTKTGLAYALKINSKFSAGIQINYQTTRFGDVYAPLSTLTAELGIHALITENLSFGVHLYNPSRSKVSTSPLEYYPTILRTGLNWTFSKKFFIVAEGMKDIDHPFVFKVGAEYVAHEKIHIRAGISTQPVLNTIGMRLLLNNLSLDLSAGYHLVLGVSSQAGLTYSFASKKLVTE